MLGRNDLFIGKITNLMDNIIIGSTTVSPYTGEKVIFYNNVSRYVECEACVFEIHNGRIKMLLTKGKQENLFVGYSIFRTNQTMTLSLDWNILGTIITPFGKKLNSINIDLDEHLSLNSNFFSFEYKEIHAESPDIISRKLVSKPLLTGLNVVDCLIPVGFGQRQLIIGDNNTGKSSLAITVILNQNQFNKDYSSFLKKKIFIPFFKPCIYVSIGQKRSEVARLQAVLRNNDSSWYTCILFTSSDDLPVIQYYAPYSGCTIGEWFMYKGYDCLLVFDDLSQHSVAYRQMTLLLRRPPGREAFPGDVFFLHSRLLERSAQLADYKGEGSLTSLPIIETLCGDVSSYIPTNVISITDGQLFLSKNLFNRGVIPAVNLGLSVSRVGSSAQYSSMITVSKTIKAHLSLYNQFKDAELLGSSSNHLVGKYIKRGQRLTLFFTQPLYGTQRFFKQIVYLYCLGEGFADDLDVRLTKFFLASLFNREYNSYIDLKGTYISFFLNDLHFENYLKSFGLNKHLKTLLSDWLLCFKTFFSNMVLPMVKAFENQTYIWSLISDYQDSF